MRKYLIILNLCLLMSGSGLCNIVSYTYTGRIGSVWGTSFFGTHPVVGDSITGFLSYDTAAPFTTISATERKYAENTPFTFGFTLRGLTLQSDGAFTIDVSNQTMSGGNVIHSVQMGDNDNIIKLNGAQSNVVGYDLAFTIQNPNLSLDLPTSFANIGPISFAHGSLTTLFASGVTYDITSMTLVPEPAVSSLILGGICLLWLKRPSLRAPIPTRLRHSAQRWSE